MQEGTPAWLLARAAFHVARAGFWHEAASLVPTCRVVAGSGPGVRVGREDEHLINALLVAPSSVPRMHAVIRTANVARIGALGLLCDARLMESSRDDLGQPMCVAATLRGLPTVLHAVLHLPAMTAAAVNAVIVKPPAKKATAPPAAKKVAATKAPLKYPLDIPLSDGDCALAAACRVLASNPHSSSGVSWGARVPSGGASAAPRAGLSACVLLLAQSGRLDAARVSPADQSNALHCAARALQPDALRALVVAPGYSPALLGASDAQGRSPQSWLASLLGDAATACFNVLTFAGGLRPDIAAADGCNAVHCAATLGATAALETLLDRAAEAAAGDGGVAAALVAARASTAHRDNRAGHSTFSAAAYRLSVAQGAGVRACLLLLVRRGLVSPAALGGEGHPALYHASRGNVPGSVFRQLLLHSDAAAALAAPLQGSAHCTATQLADTPENSDAGAHAAASDADPPCRPHEYLLAAIGAGLTPPGLQGLHGGSLLYWAARAGLVDAVAQLIAQGGCTPELGAARASGGDTLWYRYGAGAGPGGHTPFSVVCAMLLDRLIKNPTAKIAPHLPPSRDYAAVAALLVAAGLVAPADKGGSANRSALVCAVEAAQPDLVEALLWDPRCTRELLLAPPPPPAAGSLPERSPFGRAAELARASEASPEVVVALRRCAASIIASAKVPAHRVSADAIGGSPCACLAR